MIRSLYTAVSGMITQEAKQEVITNNLANVDTNGYKADILETKKFDDVFIENYDKVVNGKNVRNVIGSLSLGSQIDGTDKSFSQGVLQATSKTTDFAIDGRGFFTVGSPDQLGNIKNFYTRDGSFNVDTKGYLVTSGGQYVMGTNLKTNAIEPIKVNDSKIACDVNNNISLDGKLTYKLNVTDFNDYKSLRAVGDNLYEGLAAPSNNQDITVKQMSLEKSNVNVTSEMINMMTVLREYESNQKVIQAMDETLGKAVNELGTVR